MSELFEEHEHPLFQVDAMFFYCCQCHNDFKGKTIQENPYYCDKCDFYVCPNCYKEELKKYKKKIAEEDVESRYDASYIKDVKHDGMDPIKYDDLKKAFAYVDVDKSGTIEIDELRNELLKLRDEVAKKYPDLAIYEIVDMIISKCDINDDGKISFKEMVDVFTEKEITDLKDKDNTDAIFKEFCNAYGEINVENLKNVAKELGEDPKECERMLFYADTDGDGFVSKEEFYAILNMSEDELIERAKAWKDHKDGKKNTGSKKPKSGKNGRK